MPSSDPTQRFLDILQIGETRRLLTNRHVMQEDLLSPDRAWQSYQVLRTDRRIGYLGEPAELREIWSAFTPIHLNSPNRWTDAQRTFAPNVDRRKYGLPLPHGRGSE